MGLLSLVNEKPVHLVLAKDRVRSVKRGHPWIFPEVRRLVLGPCYPPSSMSLHALSCCERGYAHAGLCVSHVGCPPQFPYRGSNGLGGAPVARLGSSGEINRMQRSGAGRWAAAKIPSTGCGLIVHCDIRYV